MQVNTPEEVQAIKTTEFMKEKIKQRPINKKKLVRRLLISVLMAVVMGLVACITFIVLEPVINRKINSEEPLEEEPVNEIRFTEETEPEETLPEDLIADESEFAPPPVIIEQQGPLNDEQIEQVLSRMKFGLEDYMSLNMAVSDKVREVQKSLVDVIGITKDMDWFDDSYESEHVISGVIVADNGREMLILANMNSLSAYDSLEVLFKNGESYPADIKKKDTATGLAVIAVNKNYLSQNTKNNLEIIKMGSSASRTTIGMPVIALGRPLGGSSTSMSFGYVSSYGSQIEFVDGAYSMITTDIYGSRSANGVLVSARGELIGIIDMEHNSEDLKNLISGLGISDLKILVEALSNGRNIPYFGFYGTDVTEEIGRRMGIPVGVYIKSLEPDSPMLEAGMQSGDIITRFGGTSVISYQELKTLMLTCEPEQSVLIEFMRQGADGYTDQSLIVAPKAQIQEGE
ncbi:MAG: S1C family serine protease [Lachnospiraceae bacterium]|nr:S1C family serine protease [Lachnospiraceae bacterium]